LYKQSTLDVASLVACPVSYLLTMGHQIVKYNPEEDS